MIIRLPFTAYVDANVIYQGRAYSELAQGNYLIIIKSDRSFSIHASDKIGPRNYQSAGCQITLAKTGDKYLLRAVSKRESIDVYIRSFKWIKLPRDWALHHVKISKTEADLVNKIINQPHKYFDFIPSKIEKEYKTAVGPIDICAFNNEERHFVEVKRNKITINNCVQLRKYLDSVDDVIGYVAAPGIALNAKIYCDNHNIRFIKVTFED